MLRKLAVMMLLGGCAPIDIGTLPPPPVALAISRIEDGAPPGAERRPVGLGQSVRVAIQVTNRGGAPAANVVGELILRRRDDGSAVTGATIVPIEPAPRAIAPLETVALAFRVDVSPTARPGEWVVSARVGADRGGIREAPEAVRRTWVVMRPAGLVVTRIFTREGNTSLGYTSLNPGCPVVLGADVHNPGELPAGVREAGRVREPAQADLAAGPIGWQPSPEIPGGGTSNVSFRVGVGERVLVGVPLVARVRVAGMDGVGGPPLMAVGPATEPVTLVASASRLEVVELSPARIVAAAGQTGVELRVRVRYRPGPASAPMVERVRVELQFGRLASAWHVLPSSGNPTSLTACDPPPAPCEGSTFGFLLDVPAEIGAGATPVGAAAVALDHVRGEVPQVAICGQSDPAVPASLATIETAP